MSECIKTGAMVFLKQYGTYMRGDAFLIELETQDVPDIYFFRLNEWSCEMQFPKDEALHFIVHEIEHSFIADQNGMSTLIAKRADYLGYDGRYIHPELYLKNREIKSS